MVTLLDKILDFFASLKLAICLILGLAFYLAAATFYESQYGTRAVQDLIYGSRPFVLLMAMLSINVMAAVLVRYPWKRKQTGFIITHCGIEILLLGCLLSFRYSVDGRVSLTPGQKSEVINLNDEEIGITMADAGGRDRRHVFPVQLWRDAGYPGLASYIASAAHLIDLPLQPSWADGHTVTWPIGGGAKLQVLDWLPAADGQTIIKPAPDGFPAAIVHLGGHLPNGMAMDQDVPLLADGQGDGMSHPFGGTLEIDLWKARTGDEVAEFMSPPNPASLPEMGRLNFHLNNKVYPLDISKENLGKPQALGDSGYTASVDDYLLKPPPPSLPENHGQAAIASEPIDPQITLTLTGPKGVRKFILAAWHPQFMAHLDDAVAPGDDPTAQHGLTSPDDPLIVYWHPMTYFTVKEGTRGRLWLLQSPDGRLYGHLFQLAQADQKPLAPFEVHAGQAFPGTWLSIVPSVTQFSSSGTLASDFRQAHVTPSQMDDHPRAIKLALDVDGSHQETWLALGDNPVELATPRGPVQLDYSFREYELGFAVGLNHAEQTNDPGSEQAAAYTSEVTVMGSDKADGTHTITMNNPLTIQGLTFYQAAFSNDGVPTSTLSIRHDPGWIIKYLGCALIVGGIFTMFYMKAYFQKTAAPEAKAAAARQGKSRPTGLAPSTGYAKSS